MYWSEGVEQADKEEHSTVLQPPQEEVSSTKDWSCIRNIRTTRIYKHTDSFIFTMRCYASAVLAMALCLSICLTVRLSIHHKSEFY